MSNSNLINRINDKSKFVLMNLIINAVMNTNEFISFINLQAKILSDSNIKWRPRCEDKHKKDLLISIEQKIDDFLSRYFDNLIDNPIDIFNIILSVKQCGKDFKYSYIRDLPIFKTHEKIKTIEQWHTKSKIVIFENGEAFIMQYTDSAKEKIIFHEISSVPNLYKPLELLDIINKLLEPLLLFDFGDNEETTFIHSEILKHIPFKSHFNIEHEEKALIEIWENSIKKNQTYMRRCYIYAIKKYIIDNLSTYKNEYNEIPNWKPTLQNVIKKISAL